ncbi:2969_t:CDS:2 [Dentiscutata heterogama]|uniref:2969_t:CDS:1 n=1 Tax=Dentiscutata heterogama TaxID=1316150 RepID=A0ACA9N613_9GLOM|nr:2969_t:CDS:2 [Dentiscutata heterogama]
MDENQYLTSDSNDENSMIVIGNNGIQQSHPHYRNDDKKSICWRYFEPFKVPKDGTTTKCTIDGCNTSYVWCGSTTNLLSHLKSKHGITKSSEHTTYIQSPSSNVNFKLEVNLPLVKFIVSAEASFNIFEHLKSAGFVNPQYKLTSSDLAEEQINRAYNCLFNQLKLKARQAKTIALSFYSISSCPYGHKEYHSIYMGVTCHFLSENFELHKFLLCIPKLCQKCCNLIYRNSLFEALNEWELTNQKFICISSFDIDLVEGIFKNVYQSFVQNFIPLIYDEDKDGIKYTIDNLIQICLQEWADKNIGVQGMSEIIKIIENAIKNLNAIIDFLKSKKIQKEILIMQNTLSFLVINDIKSANQIKCNCSYHKIVFLRLMECPFKQLIQNHNNYNDAFIGAGINRLNELSLDSLPFGILSKLLQLFDPLKKYNENDICLNKITQEQALELANNIMINADDMMKEVSQFNDIEHETFKSFLNLIPIYFQKTGILTKELISFLDPRIKLNHSSYTIKKYVQTECRMYYSKILSRADAQAEACLRTANTMVQDQLNFLVQNAPILPIADIIQSEVETFANALAYEEVENYIDYPDLLLNKNANILEWWQNLKGTFPGLSAVAREYLSMPLEQEMDQLENIEKLENIYQDFDTASKISFLQNNMKYFDSSLIT